MQKRVSFARALIDDPQRGDQSMPLLLYDEPTAGLILWLARGLKI